MLICQHFKPLDEWHTFQCFLQVKLSVNFECRAKIHACIVQSDNQIRHLCIKA